jgi:hypothetical protein
MRREASAAEPGGKQSSDAREPIPSATKTPESSRARLEPEARYVIQLRGSGFWWRWAVFDDLSVGNDLLWGSVAGGGRDLCSSALVGAVPPSRGRARCRPGHIHGHRLSRPSALRPRRSRGLFRADPRGGPRTRRCRVRNGDGSRFGSDVDRCHLTPPARPKSGRLQSRIPASVAWCRRSRGPSNSRCKAPQHVRAVEGGRVNQRLS